MVYLLRGVKTTLPVKGVKVTLSIKDVKTRRPVKRDFGMHQILCLRMSKSVS